MKREYKKILNYTLISVLSCVFFLTGCSKESQTTETKPYLSRQDFVLGTIATVKLYDHQSQEILDAAFDKLNEIENILSINKTNTLLDAINENAGIAPVQVDAATYHVIEKGLYYSQLTSGAFDLTIGPLVKLWDIGFPTARVPEPSEIDATLPLVDFNLVTLDESTHSVYLEKKGMQLDLGGIGKGYAADEVAKILRESGVEHAIIDLGGNVYALGDKPGNKLWTIGIQDPFGLRGNGIGTINVANKSLVTSGIYERYLETEDGKKYHHILNPATGYPYDNPIAGVSIISDYSIDGDALSTSTFALGIEDGLSFIEKLDGIDAIFVTTDYKVYVTSGIKDKFRLTSPDFTLAN